uniref:Sphingosine-1-phosphate phosphatase 2 n=1 Tax=Oncorhynchus kisutch TaxID=8019 RepID=A0A8C7IWU8_ONCKI
EQGFPTGSQHFGPRGETTPLRICKVLTLYPPQPYERRNRLLYFLFLVSAGLGHEVFTFPPCLHWNLDPFHCRRLVNIWTMVMYISQAQKAVLKRPRPLSDAVYGLPTTHAMAATTIFALLLSVAYMVQVRPMQRLEPLGSPAKLLLLSLGGDSSHLYTGMYSDLDVICGALISATLIVVTYPYWETFDRLQLTSPLRALVLLDHYTTILGVSAGCSVGYWVNERLGVTFEPQGVLPVPLPALTLGGLALGSAALWWTDARRRKEIEVPYKFTTYTFIGLVHSILVKTLFIVLGLL